MNTEQKINYECHGDLSPLREILLDIHNKICELKDRIKKLEDE